MIALRFSKEKKLLKCMKNLGKKISIDSTVYQDASLLKAVCRTSYSAKQWLLVITRDSDKAKCLFFSFFQVFGYQCTVPTALERRE